MPLASAEPGGATCFLLKYWKTRAVEPQDGAEGNRLRLSEENQGGKLCVRSYKLKTKEARRWDKDLGTPRSCTVTSLPQRDSEMTESDLSLLKSVSFP